MTKRTANPAMALEMNKDPLVEENMMLRDALNAISDGFVVCDADDRVVAFNTKNSDLFPAVADVLHKGAHYADLMRAQAASGQIEAARGREGAWVKEWLDWHQAADGSPREQIFADGRTIRLNEYRTSFGRIVTVRTDITDLKAMQRQVRDSEVKFRTLLETAPIPLVLISGGRYVYANERTYSLLGVSEGKLIGRKTREFYANPDTHSLALSLLAKDGKVENFEAQLRRDDGALIWVMVSSAPIVYDGQPAVFAGMLDITAAKQSEDALLESEKRFRAIAESSPVPLMITKQSDGKILYANAQAKFVLGTDQGDIVGQSVASFFGDPSRRDGRAADVTEKGHLDHSEIDMRRQDGTYFPTTHSLRSIVFDGVPAIVGAFMDITEQRKAELDLRRAKDEAEAANATKSQFLAVMSHELRTPLNAIMGFSEIMTQGVFGPLGDERYQGYAVDIHESGKHLLDLLTDILDLSRIEAGHLERDEAVVDLVAIIEECIGYLRTRARDKNVAISTYIAAACPDLMADKKQTKQIVLNLLANAVKYTTPGTGIDIHVETKGTGSLDLRIIDRGPGIPNEEIERIMEPFVRLEDSLTSRVEGSGLGLAIAKSLIEGHGGQLTLISEVGHGTEAIVKFPSDRILRDAG